MPGRARVGRCGLNSDIGRTSALRLAGDGMQSCTARARGRTRGTYSVLGGPEMNQQRDLAGTTAVVTGAPSGIGRAAAEELGRHGAEVVVHGRDAARGQAAVDSITAEG